VNYGESGDFHPNPFPDDEIRHTVTADNMEQYAEYLTEGTRALLETYPDTYEIQVYPSRRTMAWPEWVLENIEDNATDAELVAGGDGIDGAYGGIPFPILHGSNEDQAQQAIWNHKTSWRGIFIELHSGEVAVETDGDYSLTMSEQDIFLTSITRKGMRARWTTRCSITCRPRNLPASCRWRRAGSRNPEPGQGATSCLGL